MKRIRIRRGDLKLPEGKGYLYICEQALNRPIQSVDCAEKISTRAQTIEQADEYLRSIGWYVVVHSRPKDPVLTITREVYCPQCKHIIEQIPNGAVSF